MTYAVEIDPYACAAHADCVDLAPEAIELEDVARVIGPLNDALALMVADACPSTAIRVLDAASGEQVYP